MAPQRVFAEHAVLGIEIFLPKLRRLDDVGVAVEDRESASVVMAASAVRLLRRLLRQPCTDAPRAASAAPHLLLGRPPVGPLDLGDALADDLLGRLDAYSRRALAPRNLAWFSTGNSYFCIVSIARQASSPS